MSNVIENMRNPAPFSHLYGKMVRHPHVLAQCPMRGCDNCQCLLCGRGLGVEERKACRICARDNEFEYYSSKEIDDWFKSLLAMHKMDCGK